jgi:hypothetical protein
VIPNARSVNRMQAFYRFATWLYPPRFRAEYQSAMRQALVDALADGEQSRFAVLLLILTDLFTSLYREYFAMARDSFSRPVLFFNAFALAGIATVLALFLYMIPQQLLRLGADDPQIQLAGDLAEKLDEGAAPVEAVAPGQVDMERSLSPFVIVYDDRGVPIASQAQLEGKTPAPPPGVFDFVRQHGEERLSWQPARSGLRRVRIAAVIRRVGHLGSGGAGFVLAGRSMAQVEDRIEHVGLMARVAWLAMLAIILAVTIGFAWFVKPDATRPA